MKSISIFCVLLVLAFSPVSGQKLKEVKPAQVGFHPARMDLVDSLFLGYTSDNHRVSGMAAIIIRKGSIAYYKAHGYNDIGKNTRLNKDDLFRIASQTKAVTAVAVMMLYEQGKFLLDDPISRYLPEFKHPQVMKAFNPADTSYISRPASREITIRDLLTHTSGISYAVIGAADHNAIYAKAGIPLGFEPRPLQLADRMKALAALPLVHDPGEKFTYGLSIDVLGYLVETISGRSLDQFFRERIFEPLGMKDTYFYIPADKQQRLATLYTYDKEGNTIPRPEDTLIDHSYPTVKHGSYYSGGAGLSSTVYDYAVFLQMLLNGGVYNGKRLLSPHIVRLISADQRPDSIPWTSPNTMGFGFEVITRKGSSLVPLHENSFSNGGFWGTHAWIDRETGMVAVLMGQHPTATWVELINKFRVVTYGALTE